jgi:CBS domain-containing protein
MEDVAGFLGSHPPFDGVGAEELARVAAVTEIEAFPGGKTIFLQGTGPTGYLRVVRSGSVEIIHDGRCWISSGLASCSGTLLRTINRSHP